MRLFICVVETLDNGELSIPFPLCTQSSHLGSLKRASVEVFAPWKLANATHQGLHFGDLNVVPLAAHQ